MKNWKLIPFFVCLTLFLCVTAFAGDTVSVTLTLSDDTCVEKAVACPENASLWYASYDDAGKTLEAGRASVQDGKAEIALSRDAETVKAFALGDNLQPLAPPAIVYGPSFYASGAAKFFDKDYAGAIADLTLAIQSEIRSDEEAHSAYLCRGRAYVASGETAENLAAAKADFEAALTLDETFSETYLDLADVYIRQADYEQAQSVLQDGLSKASDKTAIEAKIQEIESGNIQDSDGKTRRMSTYDADGVLMWRHDYEYDKQGRESSVTAYDGDGNQTGRVDLEYDANGNRLVDYGYANHNGELIRFVNQYDERGNRIKEDEYDSNGVLERQYLYQYNEKNQCVRHDSYYNSGSEGMQLMSYWLLEYNEAGQETRADIYSPEGNLTGYQTRAYDANGHLLEYCGYSDWEGEGVMSLDWRDVYEYDASGKRIRMTEYDGEGNVTRVTEYA